MIIDASIGVKWLVPEEDSEQAVRLLEKGPLYVPRLFHAEVANALWAKARKGEIDLDRVEPVSSLAHVVTDLNDADYLARALDLARELDHPVYDCIYLAAAEALGCALTTADEQFSRKLAKTAFAAVVAPLAAH